jgi:hypothetical protein
MFASQFEGFDLFMAWVACRIFLWNSILWRAGIGDIRNDGKKANDRKKGHFFEHRETSF